MKNVAFLLVLAAVMVASNGCANGPLRNFFRGAPCNTCNPPLGKVFGQGWGGGAVKNCESGVCSAPDQAVVNNQSPVNGADSYSAAKYPYPGTPSGNSFADDLRGLTPLDNNTFGNQPAVGSGAAGTLNGYVNPPSIGPLPGPSGNR